MGAVYEAVHPALKKRFAIKTLLAERAQTPNARARVRLVRPHAHRRPMNR
jgi:hypothetical protein